MRATSITAALLLACLPFTPAQAACDTGFALLTWAEVTPPTPTPAEKPLQDLPATTARPVDVSQMPYSLAGRLRTIVGPDRRYCTAQFVGDGRTLLTAAHCVRHRDGSWINALRFNRSSDLSPAAAIDRASCIATTTDWAPRTEAQGWNWARDIAAIRLEPGVAPAAGHLSIGTAAAGEAVALIGYPIDLAMGERMFEVTGALVADAGGPGTLGLVHGDPNVAVGVSGGGMFVADPGDPVGWRLVSLGAAGGRGATFGAALGTCAAELIAFVETSCP